MSCMNSSENQGSKLRRNMWWDCIIMVTNFSIQSCFWIPVLTKTHHPQMHFPSATKTRLIESSLANTKSLTLFNYVNLIISTEPILQQDHSLVQDLDFTFSFMILSNSIIIFGPGI